MQRVSELFKVQKKKLKWCQIWLFGNELFYVNALALYLTNLAAKEVLNKRNSDVLASKIYSQARNFITKNVVLNFELQRQDWTNF